MKRSFHIILTTLITFLCTVSISFSLQPQDKVYLKNGRIIDGAIIEENEDFIKIAIDEISEIKIPRDSIQYIKKISREAIEDAEKFEKEQQEKGLVNYQGNWIPKEEFERLNERDLLADEIRRLREQKATILKQITEMEGGRSYENKQFQFSFNPPQDWVQVPVTGDDAVVRFENPAQDEFTEFVKVSVSSKSGSAIDQNFIDDAIAGIENEGKGYLTKLRSFDVVNIDGLDALHITVSRYFFKETGADSERQEPYHQKMVDYLILGDTQLYKVEFTCLVKEALMFDDIFTKCIKSFVIKDRETAVVAQPAVMRRMFSPVADDSIAVLASDNEAAAMPLPRDTVTVYEQVSKVAAQSESESEKDFGKDTIFLKDGRIVTGTIMQETPEAVKIRVETDATPEYLISVARETIEEIDWIPEAERQQKLEFEEQQRQKGLVKFYGKWISREARTNFYRQAAEEQEQLLKIEEIADQRSEQEFERQQQAEREAQEADQTAEILAQLRQLEEEKEALVVQLEEQRDVTNKKLEEFLERERQKAPTGKIAKGTLDAVVKVQVRSKYSYMDEYEAAASGMIIDSDGLIITNYYIGSNPFREEWEVEVRGEGESEQFRARFIRYDPLLDVALIKIDARGLKTVALGDSDALVQGDEMIAVGAPKGYKDSYTVGRVLSVGVDLLDLIDVNFRLRWNMERKYGTAVLDDLRRRFKSDYGAVGMIQHTAITYDRYHGGALLDKHGSLVGINQNITVRGNVPVVLEPSTQSFHMGVSINSIKRQRTFSGYLR